MVNIKAGKLRYLGSVESAWVTQLCAGDTGAVGRSQTAGSAAPDPALLEHPPTALEPDTQTALETESMLSLVRHRTITHTDRLLFCGESLSTALRAVVDHALAVGADVWLVSEIHRRKVPVLLDLLGITLCGGITHPGQALTMVCRNSAGELLGANHNGWLGWACDECELARTVGYVDANGWVHVLGAIAHTLQVQDGLLTPFEGARCLETHPRVQRASLVLLSTEQAAAVGVEYGFFAVAEIVGRPSPVLEVELLDHVRRGVSAPKCPLGVVCVERLPATATGAPDLAALGKLIAGEFNFAADLPASTGQ